MISISPMGIGTVTYDATTGDRTIYIDGAER